MGVEFAFQCSGVLQSDLPPWLNTYGIVLCERRGTTEWFMRAPRDAYPGAQTCMDSKVVRAEFGSGLICPRAQTCCALKSSAPSGARQDNCADLLGLQTRRGSNHSTAHVGESNSRSNVFQIPSRICLRAQPLKNSAGRVPQAAD